MTGFGSASVERVWGTATLDLSSVNHRYQEIYVRLPKELAAWEPWFHQRLRSVYRRGKVQARVEILWAASAMAASIDRGVLKNYYEEVAQVRDSLGLVRDISLESLVNLPGVLDMHERTKLTRDDEGTEALLTGLLDDCVAAWKRMRVTEGAHLEAAVMERLAELESLARQIEESWGPAKDAAFTTMTERIAKALDAANVAALDDARFAQETVILVDRWDVSEELTRLKSHIDKFRKTGDADDSVGRKLDFIVQEMNREVNTINSKVSDAEIRWLAVEAKTAIERIREQIQNLE
jgi:uncharacterized protein (TIGR00255 family)